MQVRRSKRYAMWIAAGICVLPVVAIIPGCGGGGGGGSLNANPGRNAFTGRYIGTFEGDAAGAIGFVVNTNGAIAATVTSNNLRATYTGNGIVREDGSFSVGVLVGQNTVTFTGSFGTLSSGVFGVRNGTWRSTSNQSGTFTAEFIYATGTPTPTRPDPTATPTQPGMTPTPTTGGNA